MGEFRNNKRNGQGTLTWANGDKYVGEFRDDKPNGQGTMFAPDGAIKKMVSVPEEQPPSARYQQAQISAHYEQCNSNAEASYRANWNAACASIQQQRQQREEANLHDCIVRGTGLPEERVYANCQARYKISTPQGCSVPILLADSLNRDLANAKDRCLKEAELGHY